MAPIPSRQLLAWTLPTIAALLSYLWYKRKRIGVRSDPGQQTSKEQFQSDKISSEAELKRDKIITDTESTPNRKFSRSLSGVESTPIDIVLPPQLRASRSTPKVISDEELDLEIEKIKSMRNGSLFSNSKIESSLSPQQQQGENLKVQQTPSPPKREPNLTPPTSDQKIKNKKQKNKMVRKEIEMVSEQINSLNISNNRSSPEKHHVHENDDNSNGHKSELDFQRQSNERDSANHSPADVMLASPSLSIISDNHSEVNLMNMLLHSPIKTNTVCFQFDYHNFFLNF